MNREIKFRGITLGNDMVFGSLIEIKQDFREGPNGRHKKDFYILNKIGVPFAYPIRTESIGQFTGLQDKNGKDIWEGDLFQREIKTRDDGHILKLAIGEIVYHYGSFCMKVKESYYPLSRQSNVGNVIGNIYQTPELLIK